MRTNQFIIIVAAIAMGGGAAYLARSWLQGQLDASAAQSTSHSCCDRGRTPRIRRGLDFR